MNDVVTLILGVALFLFALYNFFDIYIINRKLKLLQKYRQELDKEFLIAPQKLNEEILAARKKEGE